MKNDYLEQIKKTPINSDAVQKIETQYHCVLPEQLKHIVSYDAEERFLGEWRFLTLKEMLEADDDLGISFSALRFIPIVDIFDNDFILYDLNKNIWIKMDIVDELVFDQANALDDFYAATGS